MNNYIQEIINKGQNILQVLEILKKRMDKRARTSFLNFFTSGSSGEFDLLGILELTIGGPRNAADIKTLTIDEQIKQEISQWVQMILPMAPEIKQSLKGTYIQEFLQEKSLLEDSLYNKSDKRKSELIHNVMEEIKWNLSIIQKYS